VEGEEMGIKKKNQEGKKEEQEVSSSTLNTNVSVLKTMLRVGTSPSAV
jgi:hypothetical protein